jgi:putative ABC transport system ATP-binding protein
MGERALSEDPATASAVSMLNVTKTYRRGRQEITVLNDLNLEIAAGEFLAIMGPSGSGKSTLLNLIGGLDRPTHGQIFVGGQQIDKISGSQLAHFRASHIGFVFQFYHLMPNLSAARNVELPLLLTHLGFAERKHNVQVALQLVGLADRATHKPSELSGGQQQRVAIARAIIADPQLLVCDEPTGDLDRHTADEILLLLRELNEHHGKTIVMVTHDEKAADYARRRIHVDKGELAGVEA